MALVSKPPEPEFATSNRPIPWIAATLSVLLPGAGQLYAGKPKRAGFVFLGLTAVVLALGQTTVWFVGLVTLLASNVLIRIWAAVDSWKIASRANVESISWYNRWYVCGFLAIVAGAVMSPLVVSLAPTEAKYIPAPSMEPGLQVGDRVVVKKIRNPQVEISLGDVVVFAFPERPDVSGVKRVAALPGQEIAIEDKQLILDGERVDESWTVFSDLAVFPKEGVPEVAVHRDHLDPIVLPPGHVFLLGDNRDQSYDSRFFGAVSMEAISGVARYIYWSNDLDRVGRAIR